MLLSTQRWVKGEYNSLKEQLIFYEELSRHYPHNMQSYGFLRAILPIHCAQLFNVRFCPKIL